MREKQRVLYWYPLSCLLTNGHELSRSVVARGDVHAILFPKEKVGIE
jgi:hypothetical protein